jgi:hypothetical protein
MLGNYSNFILLFIFFSILCNFLFADLGTYAKRLGVYDEVSVPLIFT